MTRTVCPTSVCEPLYLCERVDGRLAAFRLDRYLDQVVAVAGGQGLTLSGPAVVRGLHRQLRAWAHPVGAGPAGLYARYVGGSRITVLASAAGGQLADPLSPRALRITADPRPDAVDPAGWTGLGMVAGAGGGLAMPRGVHLFLRYRDGLVALPDEEREPTATSTALRALAADTGLHTVHGEWTVDRLHADCDSGAIAEALVTTAPPVILPVGSVRFGTSHWTVGTGQPGPTAIRAGRRLAAICTGRTRDKHGWMTTL